MSPPSNDDTHRPSRPRANTSTFAPFAQWRRGRPEVTTTTTLDPPPPSFDTIVDALTPPAVPSLNHARALAVALSTQTPRPRLASLSPILAALCAAESPPALQAAGFDILAAYWENGSSASLTTADRLSCLSLILDLNVPWMPEIWEPRFRALMTFTRSGDETVGMEASLLKVLKSWIEGAFGGLLDESVSAEEKLERQRSVETIADFLVSVVSRSEFVARLSDNDITGVLQLYGGLIDGALQHPTSSLPNLHSASTPTSNRITLKHNRTSSSTSISLALKRPVDLAVELYLNYLLVRLKAIAPGHLKTIIPYLFRALSYYASPLPRLSLDRESTPAPSPAEKKIGDLLDSLVTGPYSASCTMLLKCHLLPSTDFPASTQTALGALRTLRSSIRQSLETRMLRSYISRASSESYTASGAPGSIDLGHDMMARAWAKDDAAVWGLTRFRSTLCKAVKAWIEIGRVKTPVSPETVLNEVAGILKDMIQAFDEAGDNDDVDQEEVEAVGQILQGLVEFVRVQKNQDGSPIILDLTVTDASPSFLSTLSALLAQDITDTPLYTVLPSVILSIAQHVTDTDTAQLLVAMSGRQSLSPTSPIWLEYWQVILSIPDLYTPGRSSTRQVVMDILQSVWEFVRDIPSYRQPLASLVFEIWRTRIIDEHTDHSGAIMWRVLGDEIVSRIVETKKDNDDLDSESTPHEILHFLMDVASRRFSDFAESSPVNSTDVISPISPAQVTTTSTTPVSPTLSRIQSDYQGSGKDPDVTMPSVMSILSSLTSGNSSRSHSQPPRSQAPQRLSVESPLIPPRAPAPLPRPVGAVVAMVSSFSQLAFTPLALSETHQSLALELFRGLVELLSSSPSTRAKLTALQFLMRLRVDRDHRLYYASVDYDRDGHVDTLASLIFRGEKSGVAVDERSLDDTDVRRARPRVPQERNGRRLSRGPGRQPSNSESSRSRSRATSRILPFTSPRPLVLETMWSLPEILPFSVSAEADTPSEGLISFDPAGPHGRVVLPFSSYLTKLSDILMTEKSWDVLSYVLCHLPTQMANKHLFCGPKSRLVIGNLLSTLCSGILEGKLGSAVIQWPEGIIARDAHGLAYHSLTVLISYKRCFSEVHLQHRLVETLMLGLNGQPSTIKCCLHALSLSAFELQPSMTKYLPRILEKLSQIMSSPTNAGHIIDFLSIVGSLPALHANFTDADFKMVFGVALQYLQHHNRAEGTAALSWALSQHVRIMSYYIVYLWFLAVKLLDRPRHVKFIIRQLLLANEGKSEVDEPAEVCFDWLARYTYASADPRPANSMLSEMIMNPTSSQLLTEPAVSQKTWVTGNSVVTIRTLARRGWLEVLCRRASGSTKFLCRAENVPLVLPGDVDPDITSVAAGLTLERSTSEEHVISGDIEANKSEGSQVVHHDDPSSVSNGSASLDRPDPITGYVWSGSAPSQRRKEVDIDPSYFALQLSSYPDPQQAAVQRVVVDPAKLPSFIRSFDRMPVIDTHKVGIMYVAPGQINEKEILRNTHGSPAYTRFLEGLGRLINLRGQLDVYAGGLDPDEDGEYAYAWWDDIGQVLFHTATLMPSTDEEMSTNKKRHIGNDYVRIIWNDSGAPYRFDTLSTQFQFVNIVIEPHSRGAIAAFSNNLHENEYFKVILQRAPGMSEFTPIGDFKLISAENLPLLVRQLSLLTDWFVSIYQHTQQDTVQVEMTTNWRSRLQAIKRFRAQVLTTPKVPENLEGIVGQEIYRDFTASY